jgi:hypothetical protein
MTGGRRAYWVRVGEEWCVHADGARAGETIDVYRRDGTSSRVTLGTPVPGHSDIYAKDDSRCLNSRGEYLCGECGGYVRPGTPCWETGLRH